MCEAGVGVSAQSVHPSSHEKMSPQALKLLYPSNERPKGDPKCYTNPGIDTSLTRTGERRTSKSLCVAQLCYGYLWRSSRKIQLVN